jgi:hypothetical protein
VLFLCKEEGDSGFFLRDLGFECDVHAVGE